MTKVFIATPTTGTNVDSQLYALRNLEKKYAGRIEFVYPERCVRRIFHDFARNAMVDEFLASGADVLWFLDSDVTPPDHIMDLVTEHGDKWQAAGAPYPVLMSLGSDPQPQIVFTCYTASETGSLHPMKLPYEGTAFVDGLATGCLLLKRELVQTLTKPYFAFEYDAETRKPTAGEDLRFCKQMHAAGVKFFTDFSMVCKHQKEVDLLEINNYALRFAESAVRNYDAVIKDQVTEAIRLASAPRRPPNVTKSGLVLSAR